MRDFSHLIALGFVVAFGWPGSTFGQSTTRSTEPSDSTTATAGPFGIVGSYRFGAGNTYTPSYLLGTPGAIYRPAPSARPVGGPGVAFPGVGVPGAEWGGMLQPRPGGLMLPRPDQYPGSAPNPAGSGPAAVAPARTRADRATELLEMGDRSFRLGNIHRAEERYQQALRVQALTPDPHLRLAQIALVRSDYTRASAHLREAVASAPTPGWLLETRDLQSLYGEPADFARQIARLESHLQAHPRDRNAWLVLGAVHHLTGRHDQARDALLRLTDQPAEPALTAFLDATTIARRAESTHDEPTPAPVR